MRISTLALLPLIAATVSCGGSSGTSTEVSTNALPTPLSVSIPGDAEIAQKVYDPAYSVPDGFFVDDLVLSESRSYTVHHVLDDSRSFERCTDDLAQAQDWEAADNDSRSVTGYLVAIQENDRYFQFVRELSYEQDVGNVNDITSPGYARVFKCAHTNRDGVVRTEVDGYSGVRNATPVDANTLQDFTEYLWQFRFFNARHRVVLDSRADDSGPDLQHSLLLALAYSQGADRCDRIDVIEWRFVADPNNGEITRHFDVLHSFNAQQAGTSVQICVE